MNARCCGCDPRTCAVALGRWCLGMIFFFAGLGKVPNVGGFVQNILTQFEQTWLPKWLLVPYGYTLPCVEIILGTLVLLGAARNVVLFILGLCLITLTFGQMLLMQPAVMFYNLVYTFCAAGLLFLDEHDRWVVPWGNQPAAAPPSPAAK
jgi:thiosulfate dehydrogenase (quinone) large subunit